MLLSTIQQTLRKTDASFGTAEQFNEVCLLLENEISEKIMNSFQEFYLEQVNKQSENV